MNFLEKRSGFHSAAGEIDGAAVEAVDDSLLVVGVMATISLLSLFAYNRDFVGP
jgi:hypothetical protein